MVSDRAEGCLGVNEVTYYAVVFTESSWGLFKAAGGTTAAFPSGAWGRVAKLKSGDVLLCYMTDVMQWVGLLQVTGDPYIGTEPPIWGVGVFPARVQVRVAEELPAGSAVSAKQLVRQIPRLRAAEEKHPGSWAAYVRGSPRKWPAEDAAVVINAIRHSKTARESLPSELVRLSPCRSA